MRVALAIAALFALAACSPPTPQGGPTDPSAADAAQTDPLALALEPTLAEEIGRPVTLAVLVSRTDGDWGWIVAQPWTPEGAALDWSQTNLAERAGQGMLDGSGRTYALLRRQDGEWRVIDHAVGPTDVAWADWPQRHGAPASLFEMPTD
jgi:hypothetical protein